MFQVIQPERRVLYIQANNCVEAKDWIDILTKVSQCNKKRLTVYHPSAYLNGHWLCCKATADNTPGCTPCTGGLPANIQLDIDGDRETERIYSLFNLYMPKLEKMQEACGSKSVYDGPEEEEYSTFIIDDPKETYKTLKLIIEGVGTLEQEHAQYKRDKFKKTKYGSQEHPIVTRASRRTSGSSQRSQHIPYEVQRKSQDSAEGSISEAKQRNKREATHVAKCMDKCQAYKL